MTIWGADANGQLGREKNQPEKYDKIIGPHTNNSSPEKGNGVKMANLRRQHLMIPMNTWKRAKIHPRKKQIQESYEPEKQKDIEKQNTITWVSPDGKTTRQIDYISINHRYRNAVIKGNAA